MQELRVGDPLELDRPRASEVELAGAGEEGANDVRHQDLAGAGRARHSCRQVHVVPDVVVVDEFGFAGVHPDPKSERTARRVGLDGDRERDSGTGRREGEHEPVAERLHEPAAVLDREGSHA